MNAPTRRRVGATRQPLQPQPAAGSERAMKDPDVGRIQLLSDVLAHLAGSDRVEGRGIEVAIILQPDLNAVGLAALARAGEGVVALLCGQRYSGGAHAVALCRVKG
jgi:hypothetical protein